MNWRVALGLVMVLGGGWLAGWVQTAGGNIEIRDVRFLGAAGNQMSALLYVPRNATEAHPAPGVLAVHGYINSRETQDGFAIELARRGMVVLALDQVGHGYSAPPAFIHGFGGPDGLTYLRQQAFVDKSRIGLLGHSMGGWTVLKAAQAQPDNYAAMVLVGSSTGTFDTPEGTSAFPHNVAVVYGLWDEFATFMWDAPTGEEVARTSKLKKLFGTDHGVVVNRLYGDPSKGTARVYNMPSTTHPGEHWSSEAIGDAVQWLAKRLAAPTKLDADNQVWAWKEIGTLIALLGAAIVLFSLPVALLKTRLFEGLAGDSKPASAGTGALAMAALVPAVSYFPLFNLADKKVPLSETFPQGITNGLLLWVVANGLFAMGVLLVALFRRRALGLAWPKANLVRTVQAFLLAAVVMAVFIALLLISDVLFKTDFRIWIVAMKLPASWHWPMILHYAPALIGFFILSHGATAALIDSRMWFVDAWFRLALAYCGGFVLLLAAQYAPMLFGHALLFDEPLLTIVALQFLPLLAIVAAVHAATYRATGTVWVGAFLNGMWVTTVVVAGQATQFALPAGA